MPHARQVGTAWDKKLEDYAYTTALDRPGWAWEFLRRNKQFKQDFRLSKADAPIPIRHVSGTIYLRAKRRFLSAESWGLLTFPDPRKSGLDADVFWVPELLTHHVKAHSDHPDTVEPETFSLTDFDCHRSVLTLDSIEYVIVRHDSESARLSVTGLSILHGKRKLTYQIEGLAQIGKAFTTLQTLSRLQTKSSSQRSSDHAQRPKWHDYLVALDGNLEGRSYRDIAEVLHGSEQVKSVWTSETRYLKERMRRAVENGFALMNGEYRTLL
jgi:hypothetical protein